MSHFFCLICSCWTIYFFKIIKYIIDILDICLFLNKNHLIEFWSNLTVPPSIVKEGTVVDTKVKEKHNITLTCEASG